MKNVTLKRYKDLDIIDLNNNKSTILWTYHKYITIFNSLFLLFNITSHPSYPSKLWLLDAIKLEH